MGRFVPFEEGWQHVERGSFEPPPAAANPSHLKTNKKSQPGRWSHKKMLKMKIDPKMCMKTKGEGQDDC
jgi:hypothetical protein